MRKIILLCFTMYFMAGRIFSQKTPSKGYIGAGIGAHLSSSGHGAYYSAFISYSKGKSNITLGPCLQKRTLMLRGARLSFSYILAAQDDEGVIVENKEYKSSDVLQLGMFGYAQYVDNLPLSYHRARIESETDTVGVINWNESPISTVEGGAGVELFVRVSRLIRLRGFFGVGAYYHTTYQPGMYQERSSVLLTTGVSINIVSFRK
jgi:hypothetical protein